MDCPRMAVETRSSVQRTVKGCTDCTCSYLYTYWITAKRYHKACILVIKWTQPKLEQIIIITNNSDYISKQDDTEKQCRNYIPACDAKCQFLPRRWNHEVPCKCLYAPATKLHGVTPQNTAKLSINIRAALSAESQCLTSVSVLNSRILLKTIIRGF
jgi:hypothetical protein